MSLAHTLPHNIPIQSQILRTDWLLDVALSLSRHLGESSPSIASAITNYVTRSLNRTMLRRVENTVYFGTFIMLNRCGIGARSLPSAQVLRLLALLFDISTSNWRILMKWIRFEVCFISKRKGSWSILESGNKRIDITYMTPYMQGVSRDKAAK